MASIVKRILADGSPSYLVRFRTAVNGGRRAKIQSIRPPQRRRVSRKNSRDRTCQRLTCRPPRRTRDPWRLVDPMVADRYRPMTIDAGSWRDLLPQPHPARVRHNSPITHRSGRA